MKRDQLIKEMAAIRGEPVLSKEALKQVRRHIEAHYLDAMLDETEPFADTPTETGGSHVDGETKSH